MDDTFLNVVGLPGDPARRQPVLGFAVQRKAVAHRMRNGIDHPRVEMAVLVQRTGLPQAPDVPRAWSPRSEGS